MKILLVTLFCYMLVSCSHTVVTVVTVTTVAKKYDGLDLYPTEVYDGLMDKADVKKLLNKTIDNAEKPYSKD